MRKSYIVEKDYNNSRFDRWFKTEIIDLPQSLIEKIIRQKKIKINKKKTKTSYRLQKGDIIEIFNISNFKPNQKKIIKYKPSKKEASSYDDYILENNENFVVINKPAGIAVQSGTKSFKNIIDILKDTKYFLNKKPFIVHRLDKETSGVMIIAKTREYAQLLTSLFRIRKIHKTYIALTHGTITKEKLVLKDDLILFEKGKKVIQKAISNLRVLKTTDNYSYVELNPITGRKHQLRKQLFNLGNPIVGDDKYFFKKKILNSRRKANNLMLHAYRIKFMINNIQYNFKAPYNKHFENFLNKNIKVI